MRCLSDNEVIEHVDGLTSSERAAAIEGHIDVCPTCRQLVAELLRGDEPGAHVEHRAPVPRPRDAPPAPPAEVVPGELVRESLRADAPHRESIVARAVAVLAALSMVVVLTQGPPGTDFATPAASILLGALVYALLVYLVLRRGWYHPVLPFVSTVVELSVPFLIIWAGMQTLGSYDLDRTPSKPLIGALVVFSAIRTDPRVSLLAGGAAAAWWVVLFGQLPPEEAAEVPGQNPWLGAVFFLLAGAGGAIVARYLVGRAEHALRAARERDLFGKYILHEPLGTGGMGEVVRATYCPEGGFSKTVAVKRVRPEIAAHPARIEAFREEARISAQLAHPNLVSVFDFGRFRGSYIVTMEYVDGLPLSALIRRAGALPPSVVAYIGAELAAGLEHLHTRRGPDGRPLELVHRDVNPPNVLLSRIGEVKLADFGIAAVGQARPADGKRRFAGKVLYAAPEQLRCEPLDGRADLYALGLTLYESLTGRAVFAAPGENAISTSIPSLVDVAPETPEDLELIIMELLGLDATDRPPSAAVVRAQLTALQGATAPYPNGLTLLANAVEASLGRA